MLTESLARTPITLLACACFAVAAEEPPADPEASQPAAESKRAAEETIEFKSPPGFRPRKHGDVMLYCRREAVLGSRFKAEKCYDQAGVKELLRAEREKSEMMDRIQNCAVGSCPAG